MAFQKIFVLSLEQDFERRTHIKSHFEEIGLQDYEFISAVTANSEEVLEWYTEERVLSWPPCFRCGSERCACANNIIIPQQVANWLSHLSMWRSLPDDPDKYFLICEDDVVFHKGAIALLDEFMENFQRSSLYVLIRLGRSELPPNSELPSDPLRTNRTVQMSNEAYIINGSFGGYLSRQLKTISTTSDIWLHREMAAQSNVQALTVDPLLTRELSYDPNYARFASRIHPKGIDAEDRLRQRLHVKRVDHPEEYRDLQASWRDMTARE